MWLFGGGRGSGNPAHVPEREGSRAEPALSADDMKFVCQSLFLRIELCFQLLERRRVWVFGEREGK